MSILNVPIQIRRGTAAQMPAVLLTGELYFQTDTKNIYVGTGVGVTQVGGAVAWGLITGTISSQADLQTALALKAPLASPAFTGTPTAPTPSALDNSTKLSTTAYDDAAVLVEKNRALAAEVLLAPIANPVFTGSEKLQNSTPATSTVAQSSPIASLSGQYWTGAATAEDKWTFQIVLTNGTNGASKLTIAHTGSSGLSAVILPTILHLGSGTAIIGSDLSNGLAGFGGGGAIGILSGGTAYLCFGNGGGITCANTLSIGFSSGNNSYAGADSGISRTGAAEIGIGNGGAGDVSGKARMSKIRVTGLQIFANNAAAITGGLAAGDFYRTGADPDVVCVVH